MTHKQAAMDEPLLSNSRSNATSLARRLSSRALAFLLCVAFLSWSLVLIIFPTIRLKRESGFGLVLMLLAAPLFISLLGTIYLQVSLGQSRPRIRSKLSCLWTYPVVVDGLLGVVSAAELLLIAAFGSYSLWFMLNYVFRDASIVKQFMATPLIRPARFAIWQLWTFVVGLRLGFLGLICMSFLFLPVARGSSLLRLIDIPFEHAVRYHVWLGHLTMVLFTVHGLCFSVVWIAQGRLIEELLAWPKSRVANLPGVIALVAGIAIWLTSFGWVRKRFFELFFYTHQLYLVFIVFMAFHIGDFWFCICMAGILLFMLDRLMRFFQSRRSVGLLSSRILPCGAIELLLPKPPGLRYHALSFVFLAVPKLSALQWHPFSVSSSPYDAQDSVSLLIKPLGSWTEDLQNVLSQTNVEEKACNLLMGVEGPYGHDSDYYLKYKILVLVAGGIGVSPFVAIIRDLLHRHNMHEDHLPQEVTLVWAVKSRKELAMINLVVPGLICPGYSSQGLKLIIHAYVTREDQPDAEDGVPYIPQQLIAKAKIPSERQISTMVASYSNGLLVAYMIASIAGFLLVEVAVQKLLLHRYGDATSWPVRVSALLLSMVCGVVIFGGLILQLWHRFQSSTVSFRDGNKSESSQTQHCNADLSLVGPWNTVYGQRPDLAELFDGFANKWVDEDVGVLVCGPETLQRSVAVECRFRGAYKKGRTSAFHYHSVSFDL